MRIFEAILAVLDPNVVLRGDRGPLAPPAMSRIVRGVQEVAKGVVFGAARAAGMQLVNQPVLVNGSAGVIVFADGKPYSVIGFTVKAGKIVEINVLADPARLSQLGLAGFRRV
jgi:RNA polymerase sigma-70 factor, ECF subfamily